MLQTFLEGQPDKLWHSEYASMQQTMNPVPWDKFESFMLSTFGTIAPLSEAYNLNSANKLQQWLSL